MNTFFPYTEHGICYDGILAKFPGFCKSCIKRSQGCKQDIGVGVCNANGRKMHVCNARGRSIHICDRQSFRLGAETEIDAFLMIDAALINMRGLAAELKSLSIDYDEVLLTLSRCAARVSQKVDYTKNSGTIVVVR